MKNAWLPLCAAIVAGLIAGFVDFAFAEETITAVLLAGMAALIGLLSPRWSWATLFALIMGMSVPLLYLLLRAMNFKPSAPITPAWWAASLAVIPAAVGVYVGVAARKLLRVNPRSS